MQLYGRRDLLDAEALVEIEQRALEVPRSRWIIGAAAERRDGRRARFGVVPRDGDDGRTVVLDAGINADPDRHQTISKHRLHAGSTQVSQDAKSMKSNSLPTNLFSTSLR